MMQLVFDFAILPGRGKSHGIEIHPCEDCGVPGRYQTSRCTPCRRLKVRADKRALDPLEHMEVRFSVRHNAYVASAPGGWEAKSRTMKGAIDRLHEKILAGKSSCTVKHG